MSFATDKKNNTSHYAVMKPVTQPLINDETLEMLKQTFF